MLWSITAPLRVLYKIWFALVFLITGYLQFPLYYVLVKTHQHRLLFFFQCWLWLPLLQLFLFLPILKFKSKGYRFPEGPFIVCANHTSYLDIVMMYTVFRNRQFFFLAKDTLKKFPIIGFYFKTGDLHIAVNRENKAEASASLRAIGEKLDQGHIVVIFPEGTQSKNPPHMNAFKAGAFKLAIEKQVPVVPMTFLNNWKLLSNLGKITGPSRPGISKVVFHEAIETNGMELNDVLTLQERTKTIIETELKKRLPEYFENENHNTSR